MALYGNFADIPILELIGLIGTHSGEIIIYETTHQHNYALAVDHGVITRVLFDGQDVPNEEQALSFIAELVQSNSGEFEFNRSEPINGPHKLSITEVLLSSLAMIDEIEAFRLHFPEPDTVFINNVTVDLWMKSEMSNGWHAAYAYFVHGASPLMIQENMGLNLDQVLLNFYKLRVRGLIIPRRAFDETIYEPEQESVESTPVTATSTSRIPFAQLMIDREVMHLAETLEPIWGETVIPYEGEVLENDEGARSDFEETSNSRTTACFQNVKIDRSHPGVVKNLLKSIWHLISTK